MSAALTVAVPKGRTLKALVPLLSLSGIDVGTLLDADRTLIRQAPGLRFLLLKPDDVATYVERGAADLGVCGRDMLREHAPDVAMPLDLRIGVCRMMVAGRAGVPIPEDVPRVATKYPRIATAHFAARGAQAEIIALHGSVELAALAGLADVIVDLVETGETLKQNGLEAKEEIFAVSSLLIVNRASAKLKRAAIEPIVARLRAALGP